jgi:hypothetical protein
MSDIVITSRYHRADPLARGETDTLQRLLAMADDALAGKDQDAVEREADIVRELLGLTHH